MAFMPQSSFSGVTPPLRLGKFKASKMVVLQSWAILKHDKEIMWFPVLSAISGLIVLIVMGCTYFFLVFNGDTSIVSAIASGDEARVTSWFEQNRDVSNVVTYGILFLYYLLSFLIVNFFQAGVMIIAHARFKGEDLGLSDGLRGAARRFSKIFVWSLISATVGIILDQISQRSNTLGKIVTAIFGVAWTILTFFSLPALVLGNASITGSFSESASIIRKTWGETIIVNVGVSLFIALLMFGGVGVFLIAAVLFGNSTISLILLVLLSVYLVALTVVASALSSIFKTALYEYAKTGQVPAGFSPELIKGAIRSR